VAALCLAAAPLAAQPTPAPAPVPAPADGEPGEQRRGGGEVWGYLAVPILAVLVALIGFALGEDEEDTPLSP
jgi:hypothetical protein